MRRGGKHNLVLVIPAKYSALSVRGKTITILGDVKMRNARKLTIMFLVMVLISYMYQEMN